MNDDTLHAQVVAEIQAEQLDLPLWTRAFAEGEGDPARSKAIYIRSRVAALKRADQSLWRKLWKASCWVLLIFFALVVTLLLLLGADEWDVRGGSKFRMAICFAAPFGLVAYLFWRRVIRR